MGKIEPGNVFAIPLEDGRWAIGKVLFCSQRYKHAILVALDALLFSELPTSVDLEKNFDAIDLWTSSVSAAHYWNMIGTAELPEDHLERTRRIVGGAVWVADTFVHEASHQEMQQLPKMLAYGNVALVCEIARTLGTK